MRPVNFQAANILMTKPECMSDEECESIPAFKSEDPKDPFFIVALQPSYEDIKAIQNGGAIYLKILSDHLHPFQMFTIDEEKQEFNI